MRTAVRALFLHRDLVFHGGVPKSFLYFAQNRDRCRVNLTVAAFAPPDDDMIDAFDEAGSSTITIGDQRFVAPVRELRKTILTRSFDVVVCGSFWSYVTARVAARGTKCAVVFWIPGIGLAMRGRVRRLLFRRLARRDTLVYVSEAVRRAHEFRGHSGRSQVIYHGVDDPMISECVKPYPRSCRADFGMAMTDEVVGFVAEYVELKDHRTLLEAVRLLVDTRPHLLLLFVGTGALENAVRSTAHSLGLEDRVVFLGARSDARKILGLLDLYVHPARGEGFGLAAVEAMLAGIPVITSDQGAFPEYVLHDRTGFLARVGDPRAFAEAIDQALHDRARTREVAQAGRQTCLERFSPKRFADEFTTLLEETCAEHRCPARCRSH